MAKNRWRAGLGLLGLAVALAATGCDDERVAHPINDAPVQLEAPTPIAGGTLLVLNDIGRAVISDTDMDQVLVVDLQAMAVIHTIELNKDDEPGRVVAGSDGTAFVALRRSGEVLSVNLETGESQRESVCAAPRGLAFDEPNNQLHVACAGGEVVSINADLSAVRSRELRLDYDLRDIAMLQGKLAVSHFRAASMSMIATDGSITRGDQARGIEAFGRDFSASVAWRMLPVGDDSVLMLHQRGLQTTIPTGPPSQNGVPTPSYYGGRCLDGIVHAAVTLFDGEGNALTTQSGGGIGNIVLPVDAAISPDKTRVAVVGAGDDTLFTTEIAATKTQDRMRNCGFDGTPVLDELSTETKVIGEPVAVAYSNEGSVYVQTRQPAMLKLIDPANGRELDSVPLPGPGRRHWGHALFHRAASADSAIACASCHPEGRDDGRVWHFSNIGKRRTQTMSGGVMATMPLHWDGDMTSLHDLMGEVFVNRMAGATQPEDRIDAMGAWMDSVVAVPASVPWDSDAIARGEELFNDNNVGCANCHSGPHYTNNTNANVNTGKAFQVPALVGIAHRAPFMHNGCAPTLLDRFTNPQCGGGDAHGNTSQLDASEIDDLVAYLETL